MNSQLFVKFCYKDLIKKVGVKDKDFTWKGITSIILHLFNLKEDMILVSYHDFDGDEITISCDEDLQAFLEGRTDKTLRLLVTKIRTQKKKASNYNISKEESSRGSKTSISKDNSRSRVRSEDNSPSKAQREENKQREEDDKLFQSAPEAVLETKEIKLKEADVLSLFQKLLQTKESRKIITDFQSQHLQAEHSDLNTLFKVALETDTAVLAERLVNLVCKSLNKSSDSKDSENENKREGGKHSRSASAALYHKDLLEDREDSNFGFMDYCKDLSSNFGVKLAMMYEDGKMKLMSIPSPMNGVNGAVKKENP